MRRPICSDPANALLPWYANGSLAAEEDASVRSHLDGCAVCARELAELGELAQSLSLHGMPPGVESEPVPRRSGRPGRVAYALAAALALPALLGAYWAYLGFPGRAAPRENPSGRLLRETATLDLGPGPMRGEAAIPTLAPAPSASWVALSFLIPAVPEAPLTAELVGPSGRTLAREEGIRHDAGLRCTYSFPVDLLSDPGEYAILLRETRVKDPRSYRFPFRVALDAPR